MNWGDVLPLVVGAVSTLVIRFFARKDVREVKASTLTPEDVASFRDDISKLHVGLKGLRVDLDGLKTMFDTHVVINKPEDNGLSKGH